MISGAMNVFLEQNFKSSNKVNFIDRKVSPFEEIRLAGKRVLDMLKSRLEEQGVNTRSKNDLEIIDLAKENHLIDDHFISWLNYIFDCELKSKEFLHRDRVVLTYLVYKSKQISKGLISSL